MLKIDLHTHSIASVDGGITVQQYRQLLDKEKLNYIAVTDHNRIDFAQELHRELGDKIIVGEEIMTTAGELIGLFLTTAITSGMSPLDTVHAIHAQGGLVYLPHPFETIRHGLQIDVLESMSEYIDIVEAHNGRAVLQNPKNQALAWARQHSKPMAASSDAHVWFGAGHTYTVVEGQIAAKQLKKCLKNSAMVTGRPPITSLLFPKINRLRNKLWGQR
ncbi:MAG: PHP-associated domain-containing protein [Candidatus Saccharibacteria bacterium]